MNYKVTIVSKNRSRLGECPVWDENRKCVFWTDISAGQLHQLDVGSSTQRCIYTGEPVGGFTLQSNGDLLLFRVSDIVSLRVEDGSVTTVREFKDEGMTRFNDIIADPEGRVFAGTKGETPESGGLYRLDTDGTISKLFGGTGNANGMDFSPDLKTFYWTCSTTKKLFKFKYDRASGAIDRRELFYEVKSEEDTPDGLAVDAEGCVWSARWGGSCVKRHSPEGTVMETISFPARSISSLCFGGTDLEQLFVTSAQEEDEQSEQAGALFQVHLPSAGKKAFRSRVQIS